MTIFRPQAPHPRCLLCRHPGNGQLPLCEDCHADLPWLTSACRRCAEPLVPGTGIALCGRCLQRPPPWQLALSPLRYEFPVTQLIHAGKEEASVPSLRLLTRLFTDRFGERIREDPPQVLVPVPLHWSRLYARGYNQAAEIAWWLGHELGIEVALNSCNRPQPTPHQQGQSARQRRRNPGLAFTAERLPETVSKVALVDDVITTGSTLNALGQALRAANPNLTLEAWSLARTPAPTSP